MGDCGARRTMVKSLRYATLPRENNVTLSTLLHYLLQVRRLSIRPISVESCDFV